ncbi:MAG TPA: WbqC family protein [Eudoraea sp.]|nr:WbqC family protein [Eudoraea sp.]
MTSHFLLHPTYFPNIASFAVLAQHHVTWEIADNYQKQTFRNRCHICTDRGRHMLTIPIRHAGGEQGRQKYKEVHIDNSYQWQRQHWRSLQTAYRTSPFFEFYEEDLAPLFERRFDFLLDFNFNAIAGICRCLEIEMPKRKTSGYKPSVSCYQDARFLVNAKKAVPIKQLNYVQVFGDRHGFIKNASVLDLLFNEGSRARDYLQQQDLNFLHV